ncbi:hypothetical protein CCMA1212_005544 [Trichoderma ghanense]|uniref:Uncharacterized protein n=1 Tax=Trichoderma ghanense TaxID=65468 RepID=A0ABY2H432_9HYPO
MLSILPWALVALPLTEARFGIRATVQNNETVQCCPCVPSGLNPQDTTVTVTVTGPKETVTVSHTVVQQATTVFVTHTVAPGSPSAITHGATGHPEAPAKLETAFNAAFSSGPSTNTELLKTVTKTVQPGDGQLGDGSESPKTVTVTVNPDEPKSVEASSVVTVTVSSEDAVSSTPLPTAPKPSSSDNDRGTGAHTVTVTIGTQPKASQSIESKPSIETATSVQTPPGPETVTFVESPASPTTATATSADKPADSTSETVAVEKNPVSPSTTTVTLASNPSKPGAKTVTFVENLATQGPTTTAVAAAATTTSGDNLANPTVDTVTFAESLPQSSSSASIRSSPNPSVQTVDFVPNEPNPTITTSLPAQPAITTAPQLGTGLPVTDRFTTLTQTMTTDGNVNVEITIINIFTGETICRKEGSDEPCDSAHETFQLKPSGEVPCLTTGIFTKTATAFNTVVVTVSPGLWSNGTFATGVAPPAGAATGTGRPTLRRGRVPMVRRRL